MAVARFDGGVSPDLAAQGPDGIFVFGGDGDGGFSPVQTIAADVPGAWAPSGDESVGLAASLVDGDFDIDLVASSPGTDEVLVLLAAGDGTFASPVGYGTGADEPVVVAVGQLIGDLFPDLAVGHTDGSVALLEGQGDGTFVSRPDLLVTGLGSVADLSAVDVDDDGDTDLIVSGTDRVTLLANDDDPLTSSPITNGDFSLGLTGWQTEVVGHAESANAGSVNALGGFVQLAENESFLVSISQTFTVPPSPQTISFDLTSLGLEDPAGGIPDAFEVSLLDEAFNSLVPTFRPEATSFFNANPNGQISLASGVTVDGKSVTVDISGIAAGTEATIYFDLVGNPPGAGSVAAVDNVQIVPEAIYAETFTATPLEGPFAAAEAVAYDDVDGDGNADIVVADSALERLLVFNGDGVDGYVRSEFDVSAYGSTPRAMATGALTAGDAVADVAVTLFGSDLALTPLQADIVGPEVTFVDPAPASLVTADLTQIHLQFSEPVLDAGPTGGHSVTNPAAYQFINAGPNGIFEDGLGDDLVVPLAPIAYDPNTLEAVVTVDAAGLPLVDGAYRFVVEGDDPNLAIHDLAGNPVGDGVDAVVSFTLNTPPVLVSATDVTGDEGESVELTATFTDSGFLDPHTAVIDWGDGTVAPAQVTETDGSGAITGAHVYADNGEYTIQVTLIDAADGTDTLAAQATIDNVAPTVAPAADQAIEEGSLLSLAVATFTDPGFTSSTAGTEETFTATIDWGDGTPAEAGTVSVAPGSPGVLTIGSVVGEHTYVNDGTYAVAVTVIDDDQGSAGTVFDVVVTNAAPVVVEAEDLEGDEGQSLEWTVSFRDAGVLDSHTAVVFWGDGSSTEAEVVEADGQGIVTAGHVYADNGLYAVRVEITDDGGLVGSLESSAQILNVPPELTPADDQTAVEGQALGIAVATFTDPGFTNTAAGSEETFTATIDWGDGTPPESGEIAIVPGQPGVPTSGTVNGSHTYLDEGEYTVTVSVADDDSGTAWTTFHVSVDNAAPDVFSLVCPVGDEGQSLEFWGAFSDPGILDTHTAVVDWGDGSTSEAEVVESGGQGTIAAEHVYADNGFYTIRVDVVDNAGAIGTAQSQAAIANVAPTLVALGNQQVRAGQAFTLPVGTFTDPGFTNADAGTEETFTATIDWGDGGGPEPATVQVTQGSPGVLTAGTVTGSHTYPDTGQFTVTVTVTDDDFGTATASLILATTAKLMVVDQSAHKMFRYTGQVELLGQSDLAHSSPRGAAADPSGQTMWVVDSSKRVDVYGTDGSHLGTWTAKDAKQPQGIATDGTHVWIVGDANDRIYFYENGTSLLSGQHNADATFNLTSGNKKPSGLTTDGTTLWVTDEKKNDPRVFVYDVDGTQLGNWDLDSANNDPSGIALDAATGDLWVVDRHDAVAYFYAGAAAQRDGSLAATAPFALDAANHNPEGIADPTFYINIGDPVAGDIAVPGQVDTYLFDATAGQPLFFDRTDGSQFRLDWALTAPGGAELFRAPIADQGPLGLTESGQYTLDVYGQGDDTDAYQFTIYDVPAPVTTPITIGQVVDGEIAVPGEIDLYTFDATAGQTVFVDFQQLTGGALSVTLRAPDGTTVYSATNQVARMLDSGPLPLDQTGTYTLELDGYADKTPTYRFQVWDVPAPDVSVISVGDVADGQIETPGVWDVWHFDASAGQTLFVDFHQLTGGTLEVELRAPDDSIVYSATNQVARMLDSGPLLLDQTGTYTLEADGFGDNTPTYQFQVWDVPQDVPQPLPLNTTIAGSLVPSQTVTYIFDADAGAEIVLDVPHNENNEIGFSLYDPSDNAVFSAAAGDQIPAPLPAAGTYRFVVAGADADAHGSFTFRVQQSDVDSEGIPDNRGTDFWLTFPRGTHEWGVTPDFSVFVTAAEDTSGALAIPGLDYVTTFDLTAGQLLQIPLPQNVELALQSDQVEDKGVHLATLKDVTVQGLSREPHTTDAYLALPTDVSGTEYFVMSYANTDFALDTHHTQFAVVGTADGTQVTITPTVMAESHPAGAPFTVTLDRGQVYHLKSAEPSPADLTGTHIAATGPVAVFGGHGGTDVPIDVGAADFLIEQLPPASAWGRQFVTVPLATRTGGDTFRFLAAEDGTEVTVNGQLAATLNAGEFHEQLIDGSAEITANRPILVAQYSNGSDFDGVEGDPFMMLVPPVEQFQTDYTVGAFDFGLPAHYINVVVPDAGIGQVTIDDVAIPAGDFTPIGTSGYAGAQITVGLGPHQLAGTLPFGVFAYGFGHYESYGYPGGMSVAPIAEVTAVEVTPETATLPLGALHTVTATVTDAQQDPLEGVRVDFHVTGVNTTSGFVYSDSSGLAQFSYVGTAAGVDAIVGRVGTVFDTASVQWGLEPPVLTVTSPADGSEVEQGTVQLVTGQVVPGTPQTSIVGVTVNDQPVDALDAAGNFFSLVTVQPGANVFTFTAIDTLGSQDTVALTLTGIDPPGAGFDVDNLQNVTAFGQFDFQATTFNRRTRTLLADVRLTNTGPESLPAPSLAVVDPIQPPSVSLVGQVSNLPSPDDRPYVAFDTEIPSTGLAPGSTSGSIQLEFSNPDRSRFDFDITLLVPGNEAPSFTSVPVHLAIADRPYEYPVTATDRNGDALDFSLVEAPQTATLTGSPPVLAWTPGLDQLGLHNISLRVTDGHGGQAVQSYVLHVVEPPADNHDPVIVSSPVETFNIQASPGSDYVYQALALDADGDTPEYSLPQAPPGMTIDTQTGEVTWPNVSITTGPHNVTVAAEDGRGGQDQQSYILEIIDVAPAEIQGRVFHDENANGVQDGQETGLPGWTIYIDDNENGSRDAGEPYASTDATGDYTLAGLLPGTHVVAQQNQTGWNPVAPANGTHQITLPAGDVVTGIDFANLDNGSPSNEPPAFTTTPVTIAKVNHPYQYDANATDPDGDTLASPCWKPPQA